MRIDKDKWITAHNCGKPKWHSFTSTLIWKKDNFGPRHCLTNCALENKLLNQNCWSWYHFSQEKLPHTLKPVIAWFASTHRWKYAFRFVWATLYIIHWFFGRAAYHTQLPHFWVPYCPKRRRCSSYNNDINFPALLFLFGLGLTLMLLFLAIIFMTESQCQTSPLSSPRGGGGGGTQMLFGRGCAAEASNPVPIFKGHFGGKGYPLLGVWRKSVPIIRDF